MLDKFWAVPTVRSWFSRGWISFKVVAAVGTREGLQAVRNHRVAPEVLVQQVALRLQMRVQSGDCGVGPAREHELEERYGPASRLTSLSSRTPQLRPPPPRWASLQRDRQSLPLPDEHDQALAAGGAWLESAPLRARDIA